MRPVYQTLSDASGGALATDPIPLDLYLTPFNVSLRALVTGTVEYTVEYTESDVFAEGYDPDTDTWNALAGMDAATASAYTTLTSPVTAVRMRQTSGNGSVALAVLQAGVMG